MSLSSHLRRTEVRHVLAQQPGCQVSLHARDVEYIGVVRNLSTHGIGILLEAWLAPGTETSAQLTNACKLFTCDLQMRVIHATSQPDGSCLLGCEFAAPLPHDTVQALVR
jgi:hypothetical protein